MQPENEIRRSPEIVTLVCLSMRDNMWSSMYMVMAMIITIDIINNAAGQSTPIRTEEDNIGKNQNFD